MGSDRRSFRPVARLGNLQSTQHPANTCQLTRELSFTKSGCEWDHQSSESREPAGGVQDLVWRGQEETQIFSESADVANHTRWSCRRVVLRPWYIYLESACCINSRQREEADTYNRWYTKTATSVDFIKEIQQRWVEEIVSELD